MCKKIHATTRIYNVLRRLIINPKKKKKFENVKAHTWHEAVCNETLGRKRKSDDLIYVATMKFLIRVRACHAYQTQCSPPQHFTWRCLFGRKPNGERSNHNKTAFPGRVIVWRNNYCRPRQYKTNVSHNFRYEHTCFVITRIREVRDYFRLYGIFISHSICRMLSRF